MLPPGVFIKGNDAGPKPNPKPSGSSLSKLLKRRGSYTLAAETGSAVGNRCWLLWGRGLP